MKRYIYNSSKIVLMIIIIVAEFSVHAFANAEEKDLIRIAILQNQNSVRFDQSDRFIVKDLSGRKIKFSKNNILNISICPDGFLIDKKCYKTEKLTISSYNDVIINNLIYDGIIRLIKKDNSMLVVNELNIEDYLKGVVPMEMPADWPPEALKAQVIVARTYAIYQKISNVEKDFDLYSTTDDQVYGGKKKEDKRTNQAILNTKGLILTYDNKIIFSVYHSTAGGYTEDTKEVWLKDFPYLIGVECRFDKESPYYEWEKKINLSNIEESLRKSYDIGSISTITPFNWTRTGRVNSMRIIHSKGETIIKGNDFRKLIGYTVLPSLKFNIKEMGNDVYLEGKGAGHGVGLCQWGSKGMAKKGYKFDKILSHYYPGTKMARYK